MKFSIVITTYNRLPLLKRAIQSALNQSLPCEVVIADDGSFDGTEKYVRSLGNNVVYVRNSSNLGHSATVNAGVHAAQGDWIKLVDDDDYLATNCIEKMAEAIAACPDAAICSCQAIQVDVHEVEITRTKISGSSEAFYIPQEDIHYGMLLEMVPFGTPVQVAFRKDAFLKSGGWDAAFDGNCDDIESWIRIAQYGDAVFVNQYLAYRTLWSAGCHRHLTLQQRLEKNFLIKQKIYSLISKKHQLSLPNLKAINLYLKIHWLLVGIKHKKFLNASKVAGMAILSPLGWLAWAKITISPKHPQYFSLKLAEKLALVYPQTRKITIVISSTGGQNTNIDYQEKYVYQF